MPTYQYACTECNHAFEQFQSFSDDALTVCPQCEGRLRKVFNAVGVVFKGSGFYRNDSRTDGKSAAAASKSGADSSGSGSDAASGTSSEGGSGSSSGTSEKKSGDSSAKPAAASSSSGAAGSTSAA